MPEQTADTTLSAALLESQIRNIRLRTIEVRLQDEIDELKASWLTPKAAQKATVLGSAKALVTKLIRDGEKEQKRFKEELRPCKLPGKLPCKAGLPLGGDEG